MRALAAARSCNAVDLRCATSSSSVPAVLEWIKFASGNSDAAKREEDISRQASLVRTVATIEPAQPFTAVVILRVRGSALRCARNRVLRFGCTVLASW